MYACQHDQRFSYCLYVPAGYDEARDQTYPLAVIMHGTERGAQYYRDAFADFGERTNCIVLAPLFPGGIIEPSDLENYKFIKFHDIRFDHVLLAMIDEVGRLYRIRRERFLLHGFSGGGHFAHRFFYLHPDRLMGVSIGAPGVVTLLDSEREWWVGVRNFEGVFGKPLDFDRMRETPVQMVIGSDDIETWEITITAESRLWMPDANIAGANRQDRMRSLKTSFQQAGISVRHDVVEGVQHEGYPLVPAVADFFSEVLRNQLDT